MKKPYSLSLFIFRRDLRLTDNTGLNAALNQSQQVIPCFFIDPRQVGATNTYRSLNALQFMTESLQDLDKQLHKRHAKLYMWYGKPEETLKKLFTSHTIEAVFCNRDYTPFSTHRDQALKRLCSASSIDFIQHGDALLHEPETISKADGKPYTLFTPFYTKASKIPISTSQTLQRGAFFTKSIKGAQTSATLQANIAPVQNDLIATHGGSTQGIKILTHLSSFNAYTHDKDYPAYPTTHLSAHIKFGTVSIRQVYHAIAHSLGTKHPLVRQLYWRDFFTHIAYHFPSVFGKAFKPQYDRLWWKHDTKLFRHWCTGTTGFPLVDAGMRELVTTGFMHNRVRMVVASFLVKDMHIDWRQGEQFFAQHLVDYDPALNNGNWQWCASTGTDAQPYFRIFNPWLQQKKFDKECLYIKKWVSELRSINPSVIHTWYNPKHPTIPGYPRPLLDHGTESRLTKARIKKG